MDLGIEARKKESELAAGFLSFLFSRRVRVDLVLAELVGLRHVEVAAVAEEPRFRNDFLKGGKNRHVRIGNSAEVVGTISKRMLNASSSKMDQRVYHYWQ